MRTGSSQHDTAAVGNLKSVDEATLMRLLYISTKHGPS